MFAVIFSEYSTVHFVQGALSFEALSGKNTTISNKQAPYIEWDMVERGYKALYCIALEWSANVRQRKFTVRSNEVTVC